MQTLEYDPDACMNAFNHGATIEIEARGYRGYFWLKNAGLRDYGGFTFN